MTTHDFSIRCTTPSDWRQICDIRLATTSDTPTDFAESLEAGEGVDETVGRQRGERGIAANGAQTADMSDFGQWVGTIVAWASTEGGKLTLHVREENIRARKYYERNGFAATGYSVPYSLDATKNVLDGQAPLRVYPAGGVVGSLPPGRCGVVSVVGSRQFPVRAGRFR